MKMLKDVLSDASDKVIYVLYDFETTQNTKYSDKATLHVPDLVCVQQFCSQCEDAEDCGVLAMRSEEAPVLETSGRGHAKLSMQATRLGQYDCRDRT